MEQLSAMITDIQRSSVHDGPGFRTTVFLKGCQLHCEWCHNPETISFEPELLQYPEKCIGCGMCDEGCFSGAKVVCGRRMTVEEVLREIEQDRPYYGENGGVTVSGGEPLCQADFVCELLRRCRENGISCAMESNLCVDWKIAEPVIRQLSVLMSDFKIWDSAKHERYTGVGNERILENLARTHETGVPLILRTPVIPGVNADENEIRRIVGFASTLPNLKYYELLSYHPLGLSKAKALGREITEFDKPTRGMMEALAVAARSQGVPVYINGIPENIFLKGEKQ